MLPTPHELLLKHTIELYNNIASSGDCVGRLQVKLQVFPSPRIIWEFESLGDKACEPEEKDGELKNPLTGSWFFVDEPFVSSRGWGTLVRQPRVRMKGLARDARYGDLSIQAHSIRFYLPNAQFQRISFEGQGRIEKVIRVEHKEKSWDIGQGTGGRFVTIPLDDSWTIHLETNQEALDWLDPQQENLGTLITTSGRLYHPKEDNMRAQETHEAPSLSMDDALSKITTLAFLLSFANGGYLGPLYVEALRRNGDEFEHSARVLAYRTTPLEQIGTTWLTTDSDLEAYIECYPAFDRMGGVTPWKESFDLILKWYFQAIQPQDAQSRGKPWPIVANAVGAALERLAVAILVKELGIRGLGTPTERTRCLLKQIGISKGRGYNDIDFVQTFIGIRNDATHPTPNISVTDDRRNRVLNLAIQWVEETLLWRLGYNGEYRDRSREHYAVTGPRYDLSTRKPDW